MVAQDRKDLNPVSVGASIQLHIVRMLDLQPSLSCFFFPFFPSHLLLKQKDSVIIFFEI